MSSNQLDFYIPLDLPDPATHRYDYIDYIDIKINEDPWAEEHLGIQSPVGRYRHIYLARHKQTYPCWKWHFKRLYWYDMFGNQHYIDPYKISADLYEELIQPIERAFYAHIPLNPDAPFLTHVTTYYHHPVWIHLEGNLERHSFYGWSLYKVVEP